MYEKNLTVPVGKHQRMKASGWNNLKCHCEGFIIYCGSEYLKIFSDVRIGLFWVILINDQTEI